jgi:hypothetical protein
MAGSFGVRVGVSEAVRKGAKGRRLAVIGKACARDGRDHIA